jgi:hypothetical protein
LPAWNVGSLPVALSPNFQKVSVKVALVAVFTGLSLSTDYMLASVPNVKFMDAFYFIATFEFGLTVGVPTMIFTRTAYAIINPLGAAPGFLIPFLLAGDSIYVISGYVARRLGLFENQSSTGTRVLSLGLIGLFSAVGFDLITNFGTGLITVGGSTLQSHLWEALVFGLVTMNFPLPLGIIHEASDFVFFSTLIPPSLALLKRSGLITRGPIGIMMGRPRDNQN